jgi:hypothetical protein
MDFLGEVRASFYEVEGRATGELRRVIVSAAR